MSQSLPRFGKFSIIIPFHSFLLLSPSFLFLGLQWYPDGLFKQHPQFTEAFLSIFLFFALLSSDLVTSNDLSSASQITYSKLMFPSAFSFHSWYSSALEFLFLNCFSVLNFFCSCVVFLNAFEWTFWGFGSPLCFPQVIAVVPWTRGFEVSGPIHIGVCFFVFCFLNKYMHQFYVICGWTALWMQICRL